MKNITLVVIADDRMTAADIALQISALLRSPVTSKVSVRGLPLTVEDKGTLADCSVTIFHTPRGPETPDDEGMGAVLDFYNRNRK